MLCRTLLHPCGIEKLLQRFRLDLAYPLTRDLEDAADFRERRLLPARDGGNHIAHLEHFTLSPTQGWEKISNLLLQGLGRKSSQRVSKDCLENQCFGTFSNHADRPFHGFTPFMLRGTAACGVSAQPGTAESMSYKNSNPAICYLSSRTLHDRKVFDYTQNNCMKGEITWKILELIEQTARTTAALCDAFLAPYGESYRRIRQLTPSSATPLTDRLRERHRFYDLLYRLEKSGLITRTKDGPWRKTKKGQERHATFIERAHQPPAPSTYMRTASQTLTIVVFDIPERDRKKRDWIRATLKHLGFTQLQKSVWIGKVTLPETLLHDLKRFQLLRCVEIFAATKSGTIQQTL